MTSKMEIKPDDGTATLFTVSERLGMHFWIDEDAVFMSAPSYATGGGCDMDNAIAVEDWESFTELTPDDLSHLFGYVFKMCILHRDYVRVGYLLWFHHSAHSILSTGHFTFARTQKF